MQVDVPGGSNTEVEDARLNSLASKGLRWSFVSTVLGRVLTPITAIILARLLVPEDFGVFAVAVAVQAALMSFNDLGVSNAIIWWRGSVQEAAATATTLALATSLGLYAACFVAAPFVAQILNVPQAAGVLRLLALTVIIDGASSVPIGLLGRQFKQGSRALADWLGFLVSTSLTIWLALEGYGAWSLAWGRVIGNLVVTTSLYMLSRQRIRLGFDREIARTLIGYGLPLAGSSFLVFAMLNIDYLIVGRTLGAAALGLYTIAFNLSSWPSNVISVTIRRVSIPLFARFQHRPTELRTTFLAGNNNLMLLSAPLCAVLFALAVPIIHLLYPEDYWQAAAPLAFLAILSTGRVYIDFVYDLLAGIGRSRSLMVLQGLWVIALIPALSVGAHVSGLPGVAVAHVIVSWGIMVPLYTFAAKQGGMPLAGIIRSLARPILAGVVSAAAGVAVVAVVGVDPAGLVLGGLTVGVLYLGLGARPRDWLTLPRRFLRFEPPYPVQEHAAGGAAVWPPPGA